MKSYNSILIWIDRVLESGWLFFLPYIAFYWVFFALPLPVSLLENLFLALHTVLGISFLFFLYSHRRRHSLWIWLGIFGVLLLPGAYLEFPADPWEHFARIFSWQASGRVRDNYIATKFAYFWEWSLVKYFPLVQRRVGLTFLSSFWQTLLCYQVYLFALALGFNKRWAALHTLAFFSLFGTNLFGIRYYALSSTPLSMIALLFVYRRVVEGAYKTIIDYALLCLAVAVMLSNHTQTLLHLSLFLAGYTLFQVLQKVSSNTRRWILGSGFLILILSFAAGYFVRRSYPGLDKMLDWGEFGRLGLTKTRYFETLGVHGVLSLIFAICFFRRMPLLSLLSLVPIFSLVFVPSILLFGHILNFETFYRVIYAFPLSFAFIEGARFFFSPFLKKPNALFYGVLFFLLLLALPYKHPWRGRLFFQLVPTAEETSLKEVDELADWIKKNRNYSRECRFISDNATLFGMNAHLARPADIARRLSPPNIQKLITYPQELVWMLVNGENRKKVCGIIIRNRRLVKRNEKALRIPRVSGHWHDTTGDIAYLTDQFEETMAPLSDQIRWPFLVNQLSLMFQLVGRDDYVEMLPRRFRTIQVNEHFQIWEREEPDPGGIVPLRAGE